MSEHTDYETIEFDACGNITVKELEKSARQFGYTLVLRKLVDDSHHIDEPQKEAQSE